MRPPLGAVAPLFAALVWVFALLADGSPDQPHTLLLTGLGLILPATVAVVGLLVVRSRWSLRLAWVVLIATGMVAVGTDVTVWWYIALASSILGAVALVPIASQVRRLPAAAGPPERAVVVTLALLWVPFLIGISVAEPAWAALVIGLSAPCVALLYSRVVPGGLLMLRLVWPISTLALSVFIPWPGWLMPAFLAVAVAILARDPLVKTAFHPVREVGSTFPIPPELTPKEILDRAGLDEKGRRR